MLFYGIEGKECLPLFDYLQPMEASVAFTDKVHGNESQEELKAIIKQLKGDLEHLRSDMNDLRKDSKKFGAAGYSAAQHGIEDAADKVYRKTRKRVEDVRHDAEERTESFRETVSENPIASLGVAVGLGMVIGRLLK